MSLISELVIALRNMAQSYKETLDDRWLILKAADTIEQLSKKCRGEWIPVDAQLPEVEKEVQICAVRKLLNGKSQIIITHAMYEDGTVKENDSIWAWFDLNADWDEEEDCYIIHEGWWEYNHYLNPHSEEYNHLIDDKIIAWKPLPKPYKAESEKEK